MKFRFKSYRIFILVQGTRIYLHKVLIRFTYNKDIEIISYITNDNGIEIQQ